MIEDYYTESVGIYAQSTSTGWGSEPARTLSVTISAAMNPASGQESWAGGKQTAFIDWKLFCSDTVSIAVTDRVVYAGDTMEVVFVKDTLDMGHHKRVLLQNVAR